MRNLPFPDVTGYNHDQIARLRFFLKRCLLLSLLLTLVNLVTKIAIFKLWPADSAPTDRRSVIMPRLFLHFSDIQIRRKVFHIYMHTYVYLN